MNIYAIASLILLLISTLLASKIRKKAFIILNEDQQRQVIEVLKAQKGKTLIFIFLIILSLVCTIYQFKFLPNAFNTFLIFMFTYIIGNAVFNQYNMRKHNLPSSFIKASLIANILVIIAVIIFSFVFYKMDYR